MTTRFDGIYPALLTPFDGEGRINFEALRRLVELNIGKGVAGFYVCGSTAEAFLLTAEQRKAILEAVVDQTAGRVRIIAHVGTISQNTACDLARHACACGVDAVSSIPPFYYGFPFDCIRRYYLALADASDAPVLIYHFPANSGVQLTVDHVRQFLEDERFLGIKFTSNDLFMLSQIRMMKEDAVIFNGYDEIFLSGLAAGANGGVGSTYNFMAEKFIRIKALFDAGRVDEAMAVQREANRVIAVLSKLGVMPAEKAALTMMGIDMGQCLPPFQRLDDGQIACLRQVLKDNGCLIDA